MNYCFCFYPRAVLKINHKVFCMLEKYSLSVSLCQFEPIYDIAVLNMNVPILIKYISLRTSFTLHIHTYRTDHVKLDKQSGFICEKTISLFQ